MSSLGGFGSVRFTYGATSVEFTGAYGEPTYIPIMEEIINDNDSLITRHHGYRVEITTDYLYNIVGATDEITKYQTLAQMLTLLVDPTSQNTITIQPKYNSSYSNLSYVCVLDSPITFKEIARVETGQMINLKWKAVDKVWDIPSMIHTDALTYWDGTDTYVDDGADSYVDQ